MFTAPGSRSFRALCAVFVFAAGPAFAMFTAVIQSDLDTTIYDTSDGNSALSNGAGQYLFAGQTGINNAFEIRRGLVHFEVASALPAGAVIESAILQMTVSMTPRRAGDTPFALHRALTGWGEGTSDPPGNEGPGAAATPGDATWMYNVFATSMWSTPGGDFVPAPSASRMVGDPRNYLWIDPGLASDVQRWVDDPSRNFGWFIIGDESGPPGMTARRFDAHGATVQDNAPTLYVAYNVIPEPGSLWLVLAGAVVLARRGCALKPFPGEVAEAGTSALLCCRRPRTGHSV